MTNGEHRHSVQRWLAGIFIIFCFSLVLLVGWWIQSSVATRPADVKSFLDEETPKLHKKLDKLETDLEVIKKKLNIPIEEEEK